LKENLKSDGIEGTEDVFLKRRQRQRK